jgi:hypothetical protein
MLLQSHDDVLYVFPALPEGWEGRFRLHAPGPAQVEGEARAGAVRSVRVRPGRDGRVTLANPWPGRSVRVTEGGSEVATGDGERVAWEGRAGTTYEVAPA